LLGAPSSDVQWPERRSRTLSDGRGALRLLLTSAGIKNPSIHAAFLEVDDTVEAVSEGHWKLFER